MNKNDSDKITIIFIHLLFYHPRGEIINNNGNKTYHWKSIYNEFNKWSHDNIFEDAFNDFIKKFYFKISQIKKNTPRMLKQ